MQFVVLAVLNQSIPVVVQALPTSSKPSVQHLQTNRKSLTCIAISFSGTIFMTTGNSSHPVASPPAEHRTPDSGLRAFGPSVDRVQTCDWLSQYLRVWTVCTSALWGLYRTLSSHHRFKHLNSPSFLSSQKAHTVNGWC